MLADSRMDKVIGRIIFLTVSIKTIKFIRAKGVLVGTIWDNILFVLFVHPKIIMDNHIERAVGNVIIIWAVGVNVKGESEMMFIMKINENVIIKILIVPFVGFDCVKAFISFIRCESVKLTIIVILLFFFNFVMIIIISGRNTDDQFIDINLMDGSNLENKLFIIFSLYFFF
jgi:hypothetical protein